MSGHGHITPNENGSKARCGGPAICSVCALELAQQKAARANEDQETIDEIYHEVWAIVDDLNCLKTRILEVGQQLKTVVSSEVFK